VAVVATRWGVFTPDTRPDLYQDPGGFLSSTVQAWVDGASGLGQGNFNSGAAPVAVVVWVIRTLGAPPWLALRLWRLLLLLVGAWGIRRYLEALMGRRLTAAGRLVATAFWVANPYVVVAGSTTPILLPYALLPWTLLAFLGATRAPRSWRWPALFGLAFFAQSGLNAGVVPFFQLLALPAHLVHARVVERRRWRDLGRVVVRCGAAAVAVSLYWLLPSFLASGTGAGIAVGTESPRDVARTSSYAESARLLGNWPLYGRAGGRLFMGDYTVYLTNALVLLATFAIPVAVGLSLWASKARERLLVVVLLLSGLPVMVGLFPPANPHPAGDLLAAAFDRIPATLAFRTTNKVGAVVVLAETIALVFGLRAWQSRLRRSGRGLRLGAWGLVVALLAAVSAPVWDGGLYPLGYTIPDTWHAATRALDRAAPDARVLVVPGGTGGNYRWGMRSPDDLFPSLLERPVATRNTVVSRGDPTGNLLAGFDTAMAQGALPAGAVSTEARYLGARDVLVRNDLLTEEAGGPRPATVMAQVAADAGLIRTAGYGRTGTDTIPGTSGRASKRDRATDPVDASYRPLYTYRVADPLPVVRVAPASAQVLVDGDGDAFPPLVGEGILDGTQPVRYLGDLDGEGFAEAVARGGRIVLTDTNRRRAWDINRVANATSPTLRADESVDAGNGATLTLWPDQAAKQTVLELAGEVSVSADRDAFGLHPYGRPTNAFDGDPTTAWITGGFHTAAGNGIRIRFPELRRISSITITPWASEPSAITVVRIQVGSLRVVEALPAGGGPDTVALQPVDADRVSVTILDQSGGDNPVGISEISFGGRPVRAITRLPHSFDRLARAAGPATQQRLAALPLDVVLTRARGSVADANDDEESLLDRRFTLPQYREFAFTATADAGAVDPQLVAEARLGARRCHPVASLDGDPLEGRITSTADELDDGIVRIEGCRPVDLQAGAHDLLTVFGVRLDQARFSSPGAAATGATPDAGTVRVSSSTRTHLDLRVSASPQGDGAWRYLRLGDTYDQRWTMTVDGVDAGPPLLVDGYSFGWAIDGRAHHVVVAFGPQGAVKGTFVLSAVGVVGVTAVAVLPAPAWLGGGRRRRGRRRGRGRGLWRGRGRGPGRSRRPGSGTRPARGPEGSRR
jgi:arabinofuranan 3-O-arabinosyltransferase